jgi:hypothetical protein
VSTFLIEVGERAYEVEAPDAATALQAVGIGSAPADDRFDLGPTKAPIGMKEGLSKPSAQANVIKEDKARRRKAQGLPEEVGAAQAAVVGAFNGLGQATWGDEIAGGLNAAADYLNKPIDRLGEGESFGDSFRRHRKSAQRYSDAAWEDSPWAYGAGMGAGIVGSSLAMPTVRGSALLAKAAPNLGAKAKNAADFTATGLTYGALQGAGEGDTFGERLRNTGIGGGVGALVGGPLGAILDVRAARGAAKSAARASEEGYGAVREALQPSQEKPFRTRQHYGQKTGNPDDFRIHEEAYRGDGEAMRLEKAHRDAVRDDINLDIDDIGASLAGSGPRIGSISEGSRILHDRMATVGRAEQALDAGRSAVQQDMLNEGASLLDQRVSRPLQGAPNAPETRFDAAAGATNRLRAAMDEAQEGVVNPAYGRAAEVPGEIYREGIENLGGRVEEGLQFRPRDPVLIGEQTTPASAQAIRLLNNPRTFRNVQDGPGPIPAANENGGVNGRGIEHVRKQLVRLQQAAFRSGNSEDSRAMKAIIEEYMNQIESAVERGLYSGDRNFLDGFRQARQLAHETFQRFYGRGQVEKDMRALINQEDMTPEKMGNLIFGTSLLSSAGQSARIAQQVRTAIGEGSQEWAGIRQQGLRWLLQRTDPSKPWDAKEATKVATHINDFLTGRGQSLAGVMFDGAERQGLGEYAKLLQSFSHQRSATPKAIEQMIKIANGDHNPEAIAQMLLGGGVVGKGNRPWQMVEALEAVFGRDSEEVGILRQMWWKQITEKNDGIQALANNIDNALTKEGSSVAQRLVPDEAARNRMIAFGKHLETLPTPAGVVNPGTAGAWWHTAKRLWKGFAPALGLAWGGADAGLTAFLSQQGMDKFLEGANIAKLKASHAGQKPPRPVKQIANKAGQVAGKAVDRSARTAGRYGTRTGPQLVLPAPQAAAEDERLTTRKPP